MGVIVACMFVHFFFLARKIIGDLIIMMKQLKVKYKNRYAKARKVPLQNKQDQAGKLPVN